MLHAIRDGFMRKKYRSGPVRRIHACVQIGHAFVNACTRRISVKGFSSEHVINTGNETRPQRKHTPVMRLLCGSIHSYADYLGRAVGYTIMGYDEYSSAHTN